MELVTFIYIVETILTLEPPSFAQHLFIFLGVSIGASFICLIILLEESDKVFFDIVTTVYKFIKKPAILYFSALLVVNVLWAFIPSKDTAYKMLAAYGVNEVYLAAKESEEVKEIAKKSLKVIEASLDKYTKEIEASDDPEAEAKSGK